MMIAKADTLILRGGERMAQRLSSKPSIQLLALIADCEAELRSRNVIQSSNIVGDLAETLVCSALGLERLSRSAKYAQSVTKKSQSAISRRVNSPANNDEAILEPAVQATSDPLKWKLPSSA